MFNITINPAHWIRVSTAARMKGIKRQAIYYHAKRGNLTLLEIDGVQFVRKSEVENLPTRSSNEERSTVMTNMSPTVEILTEAKNKESEFHEHLLAEPSSDE